MYLCICVFVFLYLFVCHTGISFFICCIYVFVYLCICIFVFVRLSHGNIIFHILEQSSFQKYITSGVFLALCHMLYLCICVFCICMFCICKFDTRECHF